MTVRINYNIANNTIINNLDSSSKMVTKAVERISSGFKINHAHDDPSGLTASELLRSQMAALEKALGNTTAANNLMSTADGALSEMNKILKDMRKAAVEAAGSSDPSVIAAAQVAFDNGYQALDRIASSSKFGDKYLLNGAQEIMFSVSSALTGGTQNNPMLDAARTNINQVYKRDGFKIQVSFNGKKGGGYDAGNLGDAAMRAQAAKPYLEIDPTLATGLFDADGRLLSKQVFDLQTRLGSRHYEFDVGASYGEIVARINQYADATGARASLTFNRDQAVNASFGTAAATAVGKGGTGDSYANAVIYNNYKSTAGGPALVAGGVSGLSGVAYGKNTDGNGDVYVKVLGSGANASYEVYKDAAMTRESLVATGKGGSAATAVNNSGLGIAVALTADAAAGDVLRVSLGNARLTDSGAGANVAAQGNDGLVDFAASTASGVHLGRNTSGDGSLHLLFEKNSDGKYVVSAYADSAHTALVARTAAPLDAIAADDRIILDAVRGAGGDTGLGLALKIGDASAFTASDDTPKSLSFQFKNLGARVYADEYGSASYLGLSQQMGGLFVDYANPGDPGSARIIGPGGGAFVKYGQDASLTVNGSVMRTAGLGLSFANRELMADLVFNAGRSGTTTIAQVGYGEGSLFTKNGSLAFSKSGLAANGDFASPYAGNDAGLSSLLNNASHASLEIIGSFAGGMQFQLGPGWEDLNRTVVGLRNMNVERMGAIRVEGDFAGDGVAHTRTLTLADAVGAGVASLGKRPDLAIRIVDQADREVAMLRAHIGSFQSNALDANENNVQSMLTTIAAAESEIRDSNMALETVNLTRGLILTSANVGMLAQMNQESKNVLKLIYWDK